MDNPVRTGIVCTSTYLDHLSESSVRGLCGRVERFRQSTVVGGLIGGRDTVRKCQVRVCGSNGWTIQSFLVWYEWGRRYIHI